MNFRQIKLINDFVANSKFYMVKMDETNNGDIGKILRGNELVKVNLDKNEVYRSIEFTNNDVLFTYDLKTNQGHNIKNPLSLLKSNLDEARIIESVYPNVFTWVFDGLSIKAYAIVPSGVSTAHSTISRYGGTYMFINILRQHLSNIGKMVKGISPDYSFLKSTSDIDEKELCVGSINKKTNLKSVVINISDSYMDVIRKSMNCESDDVIINYLTMKFWSREINPDFVVDSKSTKLERSLPIELAYVMYPDPINKIMSLYYKGSVHRDIIARFLMSVHNHADAKHIYYSVLGDDELAEVRKVGANQWNFSVNNFKKYGCPTNKDLEEFITPEYVLSHPLESIQKYFDEKYGEEDE